MTARLKYRDYADYIVNHERTAGHRPAGRLARRGRSRPSARASRTRTSCSATSTMAASGTTISPRTSASTRWRTAPISNSRCAWVSWKGPGRSISSSIREPLQKFRLAARGHGKVLPPETERARIETYMDPLPFWYEPFEEAAVDKARYPLHALTQRPMHMYHSWGSQNAWLRQITSQNRLFVHRQTAAEARPRRRRLGRGSKASTAASRARSGWSTASTRTRSGPGTPSASDAEPGG